MTSNKINLKEDKGQIKDEDESGKRAQKQPPEVFNKKVFLKISQYSQENTYTRVSPRPHSACLLKRRHCQRCFPTNFAKFQEQRFYSTPPGDCF